MAEKMVSASDQQGSSELGPRTCGRPGIGVKTEEEEVGGLGTLRDFLKVPVTSQPWIEPMPPASLASAGGFFTTSATWEASSQGYGEEKTKNKV